MAAPQQAPPTSNSLGPDKISAAADQVLHTPELVESILLNLSLEDLLTIRETNGYWRGVIEGSSKLLEAAFLKPVAVIDAYFDKKTSQWFDKATGKTVSIYKKSMFSDYHTQGVDEGSLTWEHPIYRKLLISQPALRSVTVGVYSWGFMRDDEKDIFDEWQHWHDYGVEKVKNPNGVTGGDINDSLGMPVEDVGELYLRMDFPYVRIGKKRPAKEKADWEKGPYQWKDLKNNSQLEDLRRSLKK